MQKFKPVSPIKFYLLGGIPFYLLLTLKLTGVVQWSWWWITLPIWLPLFLFALLAVAFCVFMLWPMGKGKYRRKSENAPAKRKEIWSVFPPGRPSERDIDSGKQYFEKSERL